MKFFKMLQYDLRQSFLEKPSKWLLVVLLSAFLFLRFTVDVYQYFLLELPGYLQIDPLSISFADVLLETVGGDFPYRGGDQQFTVPAAWLFVYMLCFYFTLSYARDDMARGGIQVVTRVRSKTMWWVSKCVWNALTVTCYFALLNGVLFGLTWCTGKNPDFAVNARVFDAYFAYPLPSLERSQLAMCIALCVLPWLAAVAISLVQMTLSLFIRPAFAYVFTGMWLVVGAYYANELILPNYAAGVRSITVGIYGFRPEVGAILSLAFILLSVFVGIVALRKKDMLPVQ